MDKTHQRLCVTQLDKAFDEKELDFILSDLGLDKNDPASSTKTFQNTDHKNWFA
jgi:hypothetical protein